LEFEEGREIGGVMMLLFHTAMIISNVKHPGLVGGGANNGACRRACSFTVTISGVAGLLGAVYLWVYYQQDLNQERKEDHCDGMFGTGAVSGVGDSAGMLAGGEGEERAASA
jgi:hypothetical protein